MSGPGCDFTPELKAILRKMANAKIKEGHTDPDVILQHIHEAIAEHSDLERSEIADILVGHVEGAKATRSDLERRRDSFYRELKDRQAGGAEGKKIASLEASIAKVEKAIAEQTPATGKMKGPESQTVTDLRADLKTKSAELAAIRKKSAEVNTTDPNFLKNKARQSVIKKEIAKLEQRLATGDYRKAERVSYEKTTETEKAEEQLNKIRMDIDAARRKAEFENRGLATKIADTIVEMHRAAVLTSINVGLKLPATALVNIGARPLLLEPAGKLWRLVLPGVAAKARTEGGNAPFFATEGKAIKRTAVDMWKASADMARTGTHELATLYGDKTRDQHQSDLALAQMIGNLHGAMKVPAVINHFHRSVEQIMWTEAKEMKRAGIHADTIADHLADPVTKARIGGEAFLEAKREIFQSDSAFSGLYEAALGFLKRHGTGKKGETMGNPVAFVAEKALRYIQPITNVPVNIVISDLAYATGLVAAVTHLGVAAHLGRQQVKAGAKDLNPWGNMIRALTYEQANSVFRNLKKNTVGAFGIYLGVKFMQNLGGLYSSLLRRDKDKPEDETMEFGEGDDAIEISKQLLEHPLLTSIQIGATIARLMDLAPKGDKEPTILGSAWEVSKALSTRIPQIGTVADFARDTSWNGTQKWAARQVASMNPQMLQWYARNLDTESQDPRAIALAEELEKYGILGHAAGAGVRLAGATGDKVKRKSEDWVDELKQGVPPTLGIPSRMDLEEK